MSRLRAAPVLVFAAVVFTGHAAAPVSSPSARPAVLAPATPPPAAAARPLSLSPAIAAKLASLAPGYTAPNPAGTNSVAVTTTAPAPDRPRNGIVRLPNYVVRETPPPKLKEYQILTPKGRLDLALKKFPGIRIGSLPFLNNNSIAMALLQQEIDLERRNDAYEMLSFAPAQSQKELRDLLDDTFMRHADFGGR